MILLLSTEVCLVPAADCHIVGLDPCVALGQMCLTCHPFCALSTPCPAVCLSLQVVEPVAESQPPLALLQLTKSSGKSFFPAVPVASKINPGSVSTQVPDQKDKIACWGFVCPSCQGRLFGKCDGLGCYQLSAPYS